MRLRQQDCCRCEASLGSRVTLCLKKIKQTKAPLRIYMHITADEGERLSSVVKLMVRCPCYCKLP